MRTAKRREQFIAARWQARALLAQVHGGEPGDWELSAPPDAPPGVVGRAELFVSVSHSGACVACAVGSVPLGLDLEAPQRRRDIAGLIDICCTEGEQGLFGPADREPLFYELWTVKEAWLKRRQEWIAPSRLRELDARPDEGGAIQAWVADGWWLALCTEAVDIRWHSPQPALTRRWQVKDIRLS
jgi:4'-phosphopantetheinyl transferase